MEKSKVVDKVRRRPEEKKKLVAFEEEKHVYSTGQNTVEVIVKLRKRKSENSRPKHVAAVQSAPPAEPYRTGSWGDLLNQHQRHGQSKRASETQIVKTDKDARTKEIQTINFNLKKENDSLKLQIGVLVDDLNKSRADLKDHSNTIKDLRELTDLLKYENECLTESRKQRQDQEDKFRKTTEENQNLRLQLTHLSRQYKELTTPKESEPKSISKFRSAIKEMKTTIDDEIDGMRSNNINAVDNSPAIFQQFKISQEPSVLLNDSNSFYDKELQRILHAPSTSTSNSSLSQAGDRSSTQYMAIPKASGSAPIEKQRVSPPLQQTKERGNWSKSTNHRIQNTADLVRTYSDKLSGGNGRSMLKGKGDHFLQEYPLRDSQGLIQLNVEVASSTEFLASTGNLNEYNGKRN